MTLELDYRAPTSRAPQHDIRVLLLQVREDERPALHEELCFLERLALRPEQLTCANVAEDPVPTWDEVSKFDAVMLGGAGAFSAYLDYPFTAPLVALIQRIVEEDQPFFGSCFGHQFLARALGGTVVFDEPETEVGTFEVVLNERGRADELFGHCPPRFDVHLGHHDRVEVVPPGIEVLGRTERCAVQVMRVPGRPVYGTQFHSEMSDDHMRERLLMYPEYLPGEDPVAALEGLLRPTLYVDRLLGQFVETFVVPYARARR